MRTQLLPKLYSAQAKTLWVLDSGHGIETLGKRSPEWDDCTQLMEWMFNREMSELIFRIGRENGLRMHLLVQEDFDVSLPERVKRQQELADSTKLPMVLVSNHANAWEVESARGIEVFTSVGQTKSDGIAELVLVELFKAFDSVKRRVDESDGDLDKEAHFYMLKRTSCPAILIEYGFMTNEDECKQLMTPAFREKAAMAVVDAMLKYEGIL